MCEKWFEVSTFDVSQLGGDKITCSDPLDRARARLTPVTQYMQMSARQGSLVAIIHVQDLWLSRHAAVYIDYKSMFPSEPCLSLQFFFFSPQTRMW